jgi:hypothetical protein
VIQQDEIVPRLLEACPSARSAWDEHLAWWSGKERGIYNDTAIFAHHMNTALKAGDTREFEAFFGALEGILAAGDTDTKTVAVIGVIETLQNVVSHEPPGYRPFERWLGPSHGRPGQTWSGGGAAKRASWTLCVNDDRSAVMHRGLLTSHWSGRAPRAAHCDR